MAENLGEYYYTIRADGTQVVHTASELEKQFKNVKKSVDVVTDTMQKSGQRIKEFFTAGLLVNGITTAARQLFTAISHGLDRVIQKDKELSSRLTEVKTGFSMLFESIATGLKPLVDLVLTATASILKAIGISTRSQMVDANPDLARMKMLEKMRSGLASKDELTALRQGEINTQNKITELIKLGYNEELIKRYKESSIILEEINTLEEKRSLKVGKTAEQAKKIKTLYEQIRDEMNAEFGRPDRTDYNKTSSIFSANAHESNAQKWFLADAFGADTPEEAKIKLSEIKKEFDGLILAMEKMGIDIPPELENVAAAFDSVAKAAAEISTGTLNPATLVNLFVDIGNVMKDLTTSLNNMFFAGDGVEDVSNKLKNQGDVVDELNKKLALYNDYLKTGSDYLAWLKASGGTEEEQAEIIKKEIETRKKQQKEIAEALGLKINEDGSFDIDNVNLVKSKLDLDIENAENSKNWLSEQTINDDWIHVGTRFRDDTALKIYLRKAKWLYDNGYMSAAKYAEIVRNTVENDPEKLKADIDFLSTLYDEVVADAEAGKDTVDVFTSLAGDIAEGEKEYKDLLEDGNDLLMERKKILEDINRLMGYGLIDVENIYQQDRVYQELIKNGITGTAALDELTNMGFKNQIGVVNIEVNEASTSTAEDAINARLLNIFR